MFLTSCTMWLLPDRHGSADGPRSFLQPGIHVRSPGAASPHQTHARTETQGLQPKGFLALTALLLQRAAKPKMYFLKGRGVSTAGLLLPKLQQAEDDVSSHM